MYRVLCVGCGAATAGGSAGLVIGAIALTVPALVVIGVLFAVVLRPRRADREWLRAKPAMAEAWDAAWYCGRCAGAFFVSPAMPLLVPVGQLIALGHFRQIVQSAARTDVD